MLGGIDLKKDTVIKYKKLLKEAGIIEIFPVSLLRDGEKTRVNVDGFRLLL